MAGPRAAPDLAVLKGGRGAILPVAERLFGQHGLEGVSLRQVNLAAGMGNNSAIAYHFGDKAGLVRAIYEWRLPALELARAGLVQQARRSGCADDPLTLIGIMVRPFFELIDEDGRRAHAMFMHQMMRSPDGRAIRVNMNNMSPLSDWARTEFAAALHHIPVPLLEYRLRLATISFLDALAEWERSGTLELDEACFLEEQLNMMAALCTLPVPPRLRAHFSRHAADIRVKADNPGTLNQERSDDRSG